MEELKEVSSTIERFHKAIEDSMDLRHRLFVYSYTEKMILSRPRLLNILAMDKNLAALFEGTLQL